MPNDRQYRIPRKAVERILARTDTDLEPHFAFDGLDAVEVDAGGYHDILRGRIRMPEPSPVPLLLGLSIN